MAGLVYHPLGLPMIAKKATVGPLKDPSPAEAVGSQVFPRDLELGGYITAFICFCLPVGISQIKSLLLEEPFDNVFGSSAPFLSMGEDVGPLCP
jgi:hypothetical protein